MLTQIRPLHEHVHQGSNLVVGIHIRSPRLGSSTISRMQLTHGRHVFNHRTHTSQQHALTSSSDIRQGKVARASKACDRALQCSHTRRIAIWMTSANTSDFLDSRLPILGSAGTRDMCSLLSPLPKLIHPLLFRRIIAGSSARPSTRITPWRGSSSRDGLDHQRLPRVPQL